MNIQVKITLILVTLALTVTGCQQTESYPITQPLPLPPKENTVSVNQLAAQLGLHITEKTASYTKLNDNANTVMIFASSTQGIFINGKSIGSTGIIEEKNGQIYVPASVIERIRLLLKPKSTTITKPSAKASGLVVIDAGHGGKDPGTIGTNGVYEKIVNLQVAKKVAKLLRDRGVQVIMTRNDDTFIELEERAFLANRYSPKLFISIHANSCPNPSKRGFTLYTSRSASRFSNSAANSMERALCETGLENLGVQNADYRVLVLTQCPAVLVEIGYLSNSYEAALLTTANFQNRIAQSVANGICDVLN